MSGFDQQPPAAAGASPAHPPQPVDPPQPAAPRPWLRRLRPWQRAAFGALAAVLVAGLATGGYVLWNTQTGERLTPAEADLLEVFDADEAERNRIVLPEADRPVVMKGWDFGVKVTGHGPVDRFEQDGKAHGPAEGHRLHALTLTGIDGEAADARFGATTLTSDAEDQETATAPQTGLRVHIGPDEQRLPYPAATLSEGEERVLLVSVPSGADTADLVLAEKGLSQKVSLVTGKAAEDNPAVLARENVTSRLSLRGRLTYRISTGDSDFTVPKVARYGVTAVRLTYRHPYNEYRPAGRDRAYLFLEGTLTFKKTRGLSPAWVSVRLPDGTTHTAMTHSDHRNYKWTAIEVPADFTRGTLLFSGEERFIGTYNPNKVAITVVTEKEEPLRLPEAKGGQR